MPCLLYRRWWSGGCAQPADWWLLWQNMFQIWFRQHRTQPQLHRCRGDIAMSIAKYVGTDILGSWTRRHLLCLVVLPHISRHGSLSHNQEIINIYIGWILLLGDCGSHLPQVTVNLIKLNVVDQLVQSNSNVTNYYPLSCLHLHRSYQFSPLTYCLALEDFHF